MASGRKRCLFNRLICIALLLLVYSTDRVYPSQDAQRKVPATAETEPVASEDDAVDDICIWIHPTDPAESIVIGTDKLSGLRTYDLSGRQIQHLRSGSINNIDLRYNFLIKGARAAILGATNRTARTLDFFTIDEKRMLRKVGAIQLDHDPYGSCMYYSAEKNAYYCFVTAKTGEIEQWLVEEDIPGHVAGRLVRSFTLSSKAEGCAADDELGFLYISEEHAGVWKYHAEPGVDDEWHRMVSAAGPFERISPDAEGIAIYYKPDRTGYLIVSSQGSDSYVVFRREGDNQYVGTFSISGGNIDEVTHTDGIDVTNFNLGSRFPKGLFVAQDDRDLPGLRQNFKLVRWNEIADRLDNLIEVDTRWDPRAVGSKP